MLTKLSKYTSYLNIVSLETKKDQIRRSTRTMYSEFKKTSEEHNWLSKFIMKLRRLLILRYNKEKINRKYENKDLIVEECDLYTTKIFFI